MRQTYDTGSSAPLARTPYLFPVDNTTLPYWRSQPHPIDEHRSTQKLPSECDIAIIGAGMTGVATAYHLTHNIRNTPSIVMLDARQVCSGATGRNGGHIKAQVSTVQQLIQSHGVQAALEVVEFIDAHIPAIKDVVETEGLDCEFELRRSLDIYLEQSDAEQSRAKWTESLKADLPWTTNYDCISQRYAEQVTAMKDTKAAYSMPACSLWPYKFVSQLLARLVERKAVNLQTNTPVLQVSSDADGVNILHTERGSLRASKVIFATNAYTGGISPTYLDKIIPYRGTASHITPTTPISPHLSHTYNIRYTADRVDYLNPRPDGGIVVGGGKWTFSEDRSQWWNTWDDSKQLPEAGPHFEGLMQRHFKGWEESGAQVDSMWTGIMGFTHDGLPHVGEVPGSNGSQYIAAGFNGGGMPLIFLCAKGLADMIRDGTSFEATGVPRLFKTTEKRLNNRSA